MQIDFKPILHASWSNYASFELFLLAQTSISWVLYFWGWNALLFNALAWTLVTIFSRRIRYISAHQNILHAALATAIVVIGSVLTRISIKPFSSDYFLSYDQIFRGSIATGLTRWGINNTNFGYGRKIPYHWLGESIAGWLARIGDLSEIETITRLIPYLGVALFVISSLAVLISLGASPWVTISVIVFTSGFMNQVDPGSIGTLWGAAMFMTSILFFLTGYSVTQSRSSITLLILLVGLTILCQSVLGMILAMSIICQCVVRILLYSYKRLFHLFLACCLAVVSIFIYSFFFSANSILGNQVMVGVNNWLEFSGLPIQIGGSPDSTNLGIHINSLFFTLYLASIFGVSFFGIFKRDLLGTLTRLFALQFVLSLVLINLIDLGEFNVKLLAPIGLLGTLLGVLTVSNFFEIILKYKAGFALMSCFVLFVFVLRQEYLSNWLINYREGLVYLMCIGVAFLFVLFSVLRLRKLSANRFVFGFRLFIPLFCSFFFVLSKVESLQNSRVFQATYSMEAMFDSGQTRDCLDFVRYRTPGSSVIATSLWRIPGGTDEKYFLTSLLTHRLVLLDGPVYSKGLDWPSLEYFENLKNIHTSFSNSLDTASHDQLVDLGATYFLLDTRTENLDRTWANLDSQNVMFGNRDCTVIKL
jgi:hypothetical protein